MRHTDLRARGRRAAVFTGSMGVSRPLSAGVLMAAIAVGAVATMSGSAAWADAPPIAAADACGAMARFQAPGLKVLSATLAAPGVIENRQHDTFNLPEHCVVRGELDRRIGADGQPYAIGFELRLPADWAGGRFLFQGGAGTDGVISPAFGQIPISGSHATPALARGFAVVSTDAGHEGQGPDFGRDPQARADFGHVAVERVTATAKAMISRYYQQPIRRSYFMGCSNGGRQAFMATQRTPDAFDGVVAGAPGFALTQAAIAEAWDTRAFLSVAPKDTQGRPILARAFSPEDLQRVAAAVLKQCDALDGLADGMINDFKACRFDPAVLQCQAAGQDGCLSVGQVAVLRTIFNGAHDSRGAPLFGGWYYDPGVAGDGWRGWKLGRSQTAISDSANATLGRGSLGLVFMTPAQTIADPMAYDFDTAWAATRASAAQIDATSTDLVRFRGHGGKLLIVQGAADPVLSAKMVVSWFDMLSGQGDPAGFARLFVVPGMNHCGGGPSTDDVDPLTAIVDWVEHDRAPDRLIARGGSAFPGVSRPLCPYPAVARYDGGDVKDEKSFICR